MLGNKLIQAAAGSGAAGYEIERSLRFNSADSSFLARTPASAGNRRTFTISFWVKRSALGATQYITEGGSPDGATTRFMVRFLSTDKLSIANGVSTFFSSDAVYRDVSAWYHIVVAFDTPNATEANRYKIYVNGSQITGTDNYPSINADTGWNMAQAHSIGRSHIDAGSYFNGYITEFYNIDGQALTPSSFGATNATTGVWSPKAYSGSYGTNGFYLNFSDNSNTTAATLGADSSGNGNNWTPTNFSVAAGAGNDSLVDSPTQYGTDTGAGGEVRGNYCTWNALYTYGGSYANGNLEYNMVGGVRTGSTMGVTSGKWYCEIDVTDTAANREFIVGVCKMNETNPTDVFGKGVGWYASNGNKYVDGSASAYGATYANGDRVAIALDVDGGTVTFYKNGSSQGSISLPAANGAWNFVVQAAASGTNAVFKANFGQRPYINSAPTNFKALVTTNLPDPTILQGDDYFNTALYTGNGGTTNVTGVGFQPDFVWYKCRSDAFSNRVFDVVRGVSKGLTTNSTAVEEDPLNGVTSFDADGFTVGSDSGGNYNGSTFVAWNWKAGGAGSTNTDGVITSTVSANTTAGISIATYTGNGIITNFGHGLGSVPKMIIIKRRDTTADWPVYHASLPSAQGKILYLDLTIAPDTGSNFWGTNGPTSTLVELGSGHALYNASGGTYVCYAFAEIEGFSKFGSYTGNGSADGTFIYTGFRPAFIMIKQTSSSGNPWVIQDSGRSLFNLTGLSLYPNSSAAEESATGGASGFDFLSNGFKNRSSGSVQNASGGTYIYMAFSSNPFKTSLAR